MQEMAKKRIRIDLSRFKLHICLREAAELTLHFNSASRRFYLSLIALLVIEMKKQGKIFPIPLAKHIKKLALLNETVGESAGASEPDSLLPRIYRKWKSALPDIENAPLFKIVGRTKYYENGGGKTYRLSEAEKDSWANLFEYTGSEENVRLRFSTDALGASLDDMVLTYGESTGTEAWKKFIGDLKKEMEAKAISEGATDQLERGGRAKKSSAIILRRAALVAMSTLIVATVGLVGWKYYINQSQRVEPASLEKMAFPLPDKPSIAVLAFDNLSGDPDQEYFSDGITEHIISNLSRFTQLFVIARSSTFTYKGKSVKIQKIAEDLGVQYVMEGSVQRSGNRVRITAQLIDALTGRHIWSEQYDRELKDIFILQDEMTGAILEAVEIKLIWGDQSRLWSKIRAENPEAIDKNMRGLDLLVSGTTKQDVAYARKLFEEAIAIEPDYLWPYVNLGMAHWFEARFGWSESPKKSLQKATELAQKAIAMDDTIDRPHNLLAGIYAARRQFDKALAEAERGVALNPNGANAYSALSGVLGCSGRWKESIVFGKKAIRLKPFPPAFVLQWLGRAYFMTGQYDLAILTLKRAVSTNPNFLPTYAFLVACYSSINRQAEAIAAGEEVLKLNPKFTLESYAKTLPYKNKADIDRYIAALRQAGLPE
jgi:TolB-like protein/Tfp pilus assembly protein PilF